ncbi:MAG: sulfatase-like hydrolase/transferase [Patescibacteria group bacterium]|nr:sulfatase-like hydrolase/transferase [Patescibacteria group bacterium]
MPLFLLMTYLFIRAVPAAAPGYSSEVRKADTRPNVVVILADDLGWADTGCYGNTFNETPSIDRLARQGMRFTQFYAGPVCSPTRANLQSGQDQARFGITQHIPGHRRPFAKLIDPAVPPHLPLEVETFAERLGAAGYATGYFGKWHLNGLRGPGAPILATDDHHPGRFGFDEWVSVTNFYDVDPLMSRMGLFEQFQGDSSEIAVAEAVKFLEEHLPSGKPMFAVIWYGTPHSPFKALPQDRAPFSGLDENSANHYGELVAMDRSIGTLRKRLREMGIAETTLLFFCSDNGGLPRITPETVGGLRGNKGSVYEGGLRVPGIIEWPAVIRPRVTDYPACTMDLFPTVVDILGLSDDVFVQPLDGISLKPLLTGELPERTKPIPFRFGSKVAMVDNRYKLLTNDLGQADFQLYDLQADPRETNDISGEQPDRFARMKRDLLAWNETVDASFAGKDYPEGNVTPADPEPQFWFDTPAYAPYLPEWKDRWEFKPYFERRPKPTKAPRVGR